MFKEGLESPCLRLCQAKKNWVNISRQLAFAVVNSIDGAGSTCPGSPQPQVNKFGSVLVFVNYRADGHPE